MDDVKILRLYEFFGPREAMEKQILQSLRNGTHTYGNGVTIKVATLGEFFEIMKQFPEEHLKDG